MKSIILAVFVANSVAAYANNSTVTVDVIEGGGYTASYFENSAQTTPEIHVIGVYEAYTSSSPRNHATGTAFIDVAGTSNIPVDLVLSSYEPTQWILLGEGVQYIHSVLINGYYSGNVSGIDSSHVIDRTGVGNYFSACAYAWPGNSGGCDTPGLISAVEGYFGTPISTFSGAYGATEFTVTLAPVPEPSSIALFSLGMVVVASASQTKRLQRRKS
ncbi:MAG: PEP-CTERM sorting domain-containing protein [Rhodocyclaceae bacterium]|nr:PEP-CTERM sorting domain-containing protein [Rhodocyclaceae bacterium]